MTDGTDEPKRIEYRLEPIAYHVVLVEEGAETTQSSIIGGPYDAKDGYDYAYEKARQRHERLGWGPGDERIVYPERPKGVVT